jgi:biopolymer transport protein ExbD
VEQQLQSARFYELLGYTLGVLSVGIICAGVIWSLRTHISERRRKLFLIASFACLTTLCGGVLSWLVLSSPAVRPPNLSRSRPIDSRPAGADVASPPIQFDIHVDPNGALRFQGQQLPLEDLVSQLRNEQAQSRKTRVQITLHVDAQASLQVVVSTMDQLQKSGFSEISFKTGD